MKNIHTFKKSVLTTLFISFITVLFVSCGYKPSTTYAKQELGDKVFVKVRIDLKDPKNTVIVKDTITKLLVQKLGTKIVKDKNLADTIMNVSLKSVKMKVLEYDTDGYNEVYKATVKILVKYTKIQTKETKKFTVSGEDTFTVDDSDGTISDTERFEAIENASDDALDEVLSRLAINSFVK